MVKTFIPIMRILFLLSILALSSCCDKTSADKLSENIKSIGLGYHKNIKAGENAYLEIPYFAAFLFQYHDSIFQVDIDTMGNSACYSLGFTPQKRRVIDSLFNVMDNKENQIPLREYKGTCIDFMIYLSSKNGKSEFCGVPTQYDGLFGFSGKANRKKIRASKEPKIFQAKIYEFDSRYLRHYFSDEYLYKDLRVTHKAHFD